MFLKWHRSSVWGPFRTLSLSACLWHYGACAVTRSMGRALEAFKGAMFLRIGLLIMFGALAPSLTWAQGRITTVAGSQGVFPSAANNGPAADAPLLSAGGVAADSAGNIYVADSENNMVARVAPNGVLTVIAGDHGVGFGAMAVRP
jgi:hypothetical protein